MILFIKLTVCFSHCTTLSVQHVLCSENSKEMQSVNRNLHVIRDCNGTSLSFSTTATTFYNATCSVQPYHHSCRVAMAVLKHLAAHKMYCVENVK